MEKKQDVQAFNHETVFRDEVRSSSLSKARVCKCFLDEEGGQIKEKSFITDGIPEPVVGSARWNEVQSARNILNQAAQALRGF